jgi:putative transposase
MVDYNDGHRAEFGVEPICRALQVAPSTYYAAATRPASARSVRDAMLIAVLVAIWMANYRVYGAHKLWGAAQRAGHEIGRDQVARLMILAGIEGVSRRRRKVRTTRPDPSAPRPADLVERNFTATRPNALWVTEPDVRADVGRVRVRVFHRRRVLADDRRLACRRAHADRHGARRARDGPVVAGTQLEGLRCHSDAG